MFVDELCLHGHRLYSVELQKNKQNRLTVSRIDSRGMVQPISLFKETFSSLEKIERNVERLED